MGYMYQIIHLITDQFYFSVTFLLKILIYLFGLRWVLVVACGLSCSK